MTPLLAAFVAAALPPSAGVAQVTSGGAARIVAAGEVRLVEDAPRRVLTSSAAFTFALSGRSSGTLNVALMGFVASRAAARGRGSGSFLMTGTTLAHETMSVSVVNEQARTAASSDARSVAVVAQYN
jgi:hypothetical protein